LKKLIVNVLTREKRFALIDGQRVERLEIRQPIHTTLVGNIYLGTVTKVLPGMNAAFVDIGEGKNGFIYRDKLASFVLAEETKEQKDQKSISSFVHQGEKLIVQVEKDATGTKGPRLTSIIELPSDNVIYMPKGKYVAVSKKIEDTEVKDALRQFCYSIKNDDEGFIFRTSSIATSQETIIKEIDQLRQSYEELELQAKAMKKNGLLLESDHFFQEIIEIIKPITVDLEIVVDDHQFMKKLKSVFPMLSISPHNGYENIFSAFHLDGEIEKMGKRIVWLSNGAYLVIDEVEALTIIDVNTGKFSGKHDLSDTVLKTNLLAAAEAARQIRLRDLAGMILIDFIDMKYESQRKQVLEIMEAELKKDDRQSRLAGFTKLGILQLTRKKTKNSFSESQMEKCPVCDGLGKIPSTETVAFRLERELFEYRNKDIEEVMIESTEQVKKVFCGEQDKYLKSLEEILGFSINFKVAVDDKPYFRIVQLH